ncbi:hypothetical protein [Cognatishimia maritima]|uniref:Uncharacterized protein n=1 Tax=Cognatishimia maritima TaxID=870908 RepID=A0A1M5VUL4_9RHOB|nr:hypothetical protein [Cognatishimia maritima]SHH78613.1 hypothetical protein SAMN04488044_3259 [Cognatishimia maritima]
MAGALASAADTRVALKAVASIDRLIETDTGDLALREILVSAASVLRRHADAPLLDTVLSPVDETRPKYLH